MRKLCVLLLLAVAFSAAFSSSVKLEDLSKLTLSKFGKNIMQSIQLELSTNQNPVGKIIDLLQQIKDQLDQDQTDADAQFTQDSAQLNQDISDTQSSIDTTTQAIQEAKNDQAINQGLLNDNSQTLADDQAQQQIQQSILDQEVELRNQQHNEYLSQKDELNNYISGLIEGKQIISQLLANTNAMFLEKQQLKNGKPSPVITQFTQKIQTVSGYFKGLNRLISMFGQIMQTPGIQADQELVQNLINILEGLVDKLNSDLTTIQQNEATLIDLFNQKSESLNQIIDDLNNAISKLQADIAAEQVQIANDKVIIDDNTDLLSIKQDQLLEYQQELSQATDIYNQGTLTRNDEIETIDEVIAIFASFDKDQIAEYVSGYSFDY